MSILGTNQGMSFEERPDDEEEQGVGDDGSSSSDGSSVFRHPTDENDGRRLLISSTNDIAMFTDVPNYKQVYTVGLSVFMILVTLSIFIVSAIVPFECDEKNNLPVNITSQSDDDGHTHSTICFMKPVSILLYMHCSMWAIFVLCDQFIRYQHGKIRRRGYLEFFNESHVSSQLPLWIVSAWSSLLLAISTVLHDHCHSGTECAKSIHLTRTEYLTICIGLETIALLVVISSYIYQVSRFNRSKVPPDVFRDDMLTSALDYNYNSLGQMDEEVFQRQADLIRFFKDRNVVLQKALMQLNNRIMEQNNPLNA